METPDLILSKAIKKGKSQADFDSALDHYYQSCDANAATEVAQKGSHIACCKKCTFCCYLRVGVRAHEVLLIASYIEKNFTGDQRARLAERLVRHHQEVMPLSQAEHHLRNIRCPLLEDDVCSVYGVRPFSCRAYHSSDVMSCMHTFNNPTDTAEMRDMDFALLGLWQGMGAAAHSIYQQLGYDSTHYELGTALHEALSDPQCFGRWKSKKRVFVSSKSDD